ncbi:MAG: hypothetical protein ABSE86_15570 [Bryobacteraceae bacterium]|jgi:hypothetical protein
MRDFLTPVRVLLACVFFMAVAPSVNGDALTSYGSDPQPATREFFGDVGPDNVWIDISSFSEIGASDVNTNSEAGCTPAGNIPFPVRTAVTDSTGCEAGDGQTLNQSPFSATGGVLRADLFFSLEVQAQPPNGESISMNPEAFSAQPQESSIMWLPVGVSTLIVLLAGMRVLRFRRTSTSRS